MMSGGLEFVDRCGRDWRAAEGVIYHWNGRQWARETTKLYLESIRSVARDIAETIEDKSIRRQLAGKKAVNGAASFAEGDRRMAMLTKDFDCNRALLELTPLNRTRDGLREDVLPG